MLRTIWDNFEVYIANISLAIMVVLLTIQICARYFFQTGIAWSEEVSRFFFLYFVYLSACHVMAKGRHIKVEFLLDRFPGAVRILITFCGNILQIAFCLIAAYAGIVLLRGMISHPVYSPSLVMPMYYSYAVIPLAFVVMAIRIAERMMRSRPGK